MVGLVEVSLFVAARAAQVDEVYAVAELIHHRHQVVVGAHSQRARAQTQSVRRVWHTLYQLSEVVGCREYARQSEERERRVIGMYYEACACLVCHGCYLREEINQVVAQPCGVYVAVTMERRPELVERETLLRSRQTGYDVARELLFLVVRHLLVAQSCRVFLLVSIFVFGCRSFQNVEVESHHRRPLEAQGPRAVGHPEGQVGAGPVEHGHEVVCHAPYAALRQIAQCRLVVVYITVVVARLCLDVLVHRHALNDAPHESCVGYHFLPPPYLVSCPHLSVGYVVQSVHHVGGSRLSYVPQAHRVVRPVPSP